jgi:hypothetical protein
VIPDEEQLALQICLPGYHINRSNKLVLESKSDLAQRGEASPDDTDALALTFAQHVGSIEHHNRSPCFSTSSAAAGVGRTELHWSHGYSVAPARSSAF